MNLPPYLPSPVILATARHTCHNQCRPPTPASMTSLPLPPDLPGHGYPASSTLLYVSPPPGMNSSLSTPLLSLPPATSLPPAKTPLPPLLPTFPYYGKGHRPTEGSKRINPCGAMGNALNQPGRPRQN